MDNKKDAFSQLDLAMLPDTGNTLVCDNEFMIGDNLAEPYDKAEASSFIKPFHPFILNFNMMILCTGGQMRINKDLMNLEICAGDLLIVLAGSIGECLDISHDCKLVLIAFTAPLGNEIGNFAYVSLLRKQPLLHLSPDEIQEALLIYSQMRKKMEQSDYKFTRNALASYLQILFCNACNNSSVFIALLSRCFLLRSHTNTRCLFSCAFALRKNLFSYSPIYLFTSNNIFM